uniref:Uncharacterized protein n=2 Tax=viral metagenome TaxID=1070528 RepID=A0A6M3IXC8_9ZZZZ
MPSERWTKGLIAVTTASQTVIGTASCDWKNQLAAGHVIKVDDDNENTYKIATVLTASRLLLSANYDGNRGSLVFYPGASGDDASFGSANDVWGGGSNPFFTPNGYTIFMGYADGTYKRYGIIIRFPEVKIDKGVTISSAFIRFKASANYSADTIRQKIHFNEVDDAIAPTNTAEAFALENTVDAGIDWDFTTDWVTDSTYDTIDISAGLQAIFDRPGWAYGQAVMAVIVDDGSDGWNRLRQFYAFDSAGGINKAELHVELAAGTGLSYIASRSFTTNRGYWRPLQGDSDWAEIISQETIDKIDTDIQDLSASINTITASANPRFTAFQLNLINANASIDDLSANININASEIIPLQSNIVNLNASLPNLSASTNINASEIIALQTNMINANASIANLSASININASEINALIAIHTNINASIANLSASININASNIIAIIAGNASLDGTAKQSFGIKTDGYCGRLKTTNLSSSRELELPDISESLTSMAVTNYVAAPAITASIVGNASISGQLTGFKKFYTVLGTPFAVPYWSLG